jgi:Co/Zn/Cd efflux system component
VLIRAFLVNFCLTLIFQSIRGDGAQSSLTLQSAIDQALANNPELRAFEAEVASAKGGIRTAHASAMGPTETALTAHLVIPEASTDGAFLTQVSDQLREQFEIRYSTIQIERDDGTCKQESEEVV